MKASVLEEACRKWWVRTILIAASAAAAPILLSFSQVKGVAALLAFLAASLAVARITGSPLIAAALWSSAWYGSPLQGFAASLIQFAGVDALYTITTFIVAGVGFYYGFLKGGPLDPALEPLFWEARPSPLPLALASLSLIAIWLLGPLEFQFDLYYVPAVWALAAAMISSLYPIPLIYKALLGLLAGLGPSGALAALFVGASIPYCYRCPKGARLEGKLVAVIVKTSRLRGVAQLPDGRVVACARGEATVLGDSIVVIGLREASEKPVFPVEMGDSLVRGFLARGGGIASPGCEGATVLFVPNKAPSSEEAGGERYGDQRLSVEGV